MFTRIQSALQAEHITVYRIVETVEETAELFFVRHALDQRRITDVTEYQVTVFRDGKNGSGEPTRGFTSVTLDPSLSDEQLAEALRGAYFAAKFAANPYYDLPEPVQAPPVEKTGPLAETPLAESAGVMTEALFAADVREGAFLNSAELFVSRLKRRILSSEGTDVSYTDASVKGEFVVQCPSPEDVEMHVTYAYGELEPEALQAKVAEALTFVADRARASRTLKSGKYDVVFSGNALRTVLSYYAERSSASTLYAKYSGWKCGDDVQGEGVTGEALDLTLCATVPYDGEGIPMADLPLVGEGKLLAVHGGNRFCRYLGVKPTGNFSKLRCGNGKIPFEALKKAPCLWAVTFSDFQMDSFSGHFGGEIRLAYLIGEDGSVTPVTGGSVNGSLFEAQKDLQFSSERYETATYEGPYAVRMSGVSVSGSEA
ncbi:MAG: hypothetical protein J1E00_08190 [Oscillospiraceae bacterium]|nr:hypothetical protein [Oscillospiraceae bacterium]